MANLIIAIIGITLVAVTAIMTTLYFNGSLDNVQAQSWANAMMSQTRQIMAAGTSYDLDHGGSDFSSFGIADLVTNKYLSSWPPLGMTDPSPNTNNISTGINDQFNGTNKACPTLGNYTSTITRTACNLNGVNVIAWSMKLDDPYTSCNAINAGYGYGFEDARYSTHPMVEIALALNKITGAVPASATLGSSGLPYPPSGYTNDIICNGKSGITSNIAVLDASGAPVINYCFLAPGSTPPGPTIPWTSAEAIFCAFSN